MTIKAIETRYKGYRFRSRLEARWAVFFDTLGVAWEYEKEGYDLGEFGYYLPDFWLPEVYFRGRPDQQGIFIEIKPEEPSESEKRKCEALAGGGFDVFCFWGMPPGHDTGKGINFVDLGGIQFAGRDGGGSVWEDFPMLWVKCRKRSCSIVKIEFSESNYMICDLCGAVADTDHPDIVHAANTARSARFEHGEQGPVSSRKPPLNPLTRAEILALKRKFRP